MSNHFFGIKNVEYMGDTYFEEVGAELPVFKLVDIPAEEWNVKALKLNTKTFIEIFNRQPKDDEEVMRWAWSHADVKYTPEKYKNHIAGNDAAL